MEATQMTFSQGLGKLLQQMPPNLQQIIAKYADRSTEELKAEAYNLEYGPLTGYDCKICRNKGLVSEVSNGREVFLPCLCMPARDSLKRIERLGIKKLLNKCSFANYEVVFGWQQNFKNKAMEFVKAPKGVFFVGGQTGSGKTHICVTIVRHLIDIPAEVYFLPWRDESTELKGLVTQPEEYSERLAAIKKADFLYIDDLFKGEPTSADVKLAFEIVNYRYNNDLATIISSELSLPDICKLDEATGGRIIEQANGFITNISRDTNKNYRLKKGA